MRVRGLLRRLLQKVSRGGAASAAPAPQAAVFIPFLGDADALQRTRASLSLHEAGIPFELRILDASRGEALADALATARSSVLVVLKPGIEVSPEWLRSLVRPLASTDLEGVVPTLLLPDGREIVPVPGGDEPPCFAIPRSRAGLPRDFGRFHRAPDSLVVDSSSTGRPPRPGTTIAIKIPCPRPAIKDQWGDYHFAVSLAAAFLRRGVKARLDFLQDWDRRREPGDVNLVLRGLSRFTPTSDTLNLMWLISHPDKVSVEELDTYDQVFVASEVWSERMAPHCRTKVTPLLQCTDIHRFHADADDGVTRHRLLFVANSRRILRPIVKKAMDEGLAIDLYGEMWENLAPVSWIRGRNVGNIDLPRFYSGASVVLNDHWDDMRENGFVSNRLFDVLACGRPLVTDSVKGIPLELLPGCHFFDRSESLASVVAAASREPGLWTEEARTIARIVRERHSFDARAGSFLAAIDRLSAERGK